MKSSNPLMIPRIKEKGLHVRKYQKASIKKYNNQGISEEHSMLRASQSGFLTHRPSTLLQLTTIY